MDSASDHHDEVVTIDVGAQLVSANCREFRTIILEQLERGTRAICLDFSQTGYVDSSGLGVLVSLSKQAREHGRQLWLANLNEELSLLFKLTKLDKVFRLEDGGGGSAGAGVLAPVRPPPRAGGAEERTS